MSLPSFQIIAAGVASFAAQVFCYPLSVIRTRQILVEEPAKREGMFSIAVVADNHCTEKMV
jgi:hypothetical protein